MTNSPSQSPQITVNGTRRSLARTPSYLSLLDYLRGQGLTGAKEGCAEGECGACSVLVSRPDGAGSSWVAVNACLPPAVGYDGQEIVTAEGLGGSDGLHPVQEEMAHRGGSQCGYCTPGFVCSMAAEYYRADRAPAAHDADSATSSTTVAMDTGAETSTDHEHGPNGFDLHALSGNLCRCTGYRPIRDAAYALGRPSAQDPLAHRRSEPAPEAVPTRVTDGVHEFVRPSTLHEAMTLLGDDRETRLVAGSTDWGVAANLLMARSPVLVAIDRLHELRELHEGPDHVEIGAALTLSEIERRLDGRVPLLAELFPQFASRLIRNGATLGGNLGTGSPIGDSPPVLLALESQLVLASTRGERVVPLADYFTGYRRTIRDSDELIKAVRIPLPLAASAAFHKIAKRRFDDISSVAVAFAVDIEDGVVRRARIGLGGVAATPLRAYETEAALEGRPWTLQTAQAAARVLGATGTPMDDHRASSRYRAAMLRTALLKFHSQTATQEVDA
ncbi:FAD binding domain-containing protein [Allobranchiibius sp. GilTou38]|uniref:xanthine dehydrogenase small subunit n=1 Tax=Allobranchiibius sp. GilTou38 TaxID=2815210 RepID=UPI001AA0BC9D|nr:FAD binding domain-containing protein [Allobranchiibius sp. GilTou38]MBO1767343.1 FAD binding domain-containing protein [Allobranchiibius sp. GilTou38]